MYRLQYLLVAFGLLGVSAGAGACASEESTGESVEALAAGGRWMLPRAVASVGAQVRLHYDAAPDWSTRACAGELKDGASELGAFLREEFVSVNSVGGYACRKNTADGSKLSVHGTGRALDVFIPQAGGKANNTQGDLVANYLVEHATEIGVQLVIWDRTIWRANGTNDATYGGPHPHDDHLHVELTEEAAAMQTQWFRLANKDRLGDAGVTPPDAGTTPTRDAGRPAEEPRIDAGTKPPPTPKPTVDAGAGSEPPATRPPTTPAEWDVAEDGDDGPGETDSIPASKKSARAGEEVAFDSSGCSAAPAGRSVFGAPLLAIVVGLLRRRRRR